MTIPFDLIPDHPATCLVFPKMFSPRECRDLITLAEDTGFGDPSHDYPPSYRNNDRLVRDDPSLADTLYRRLRDPLAASGAPELGFSSWIGLNHRFRFCRYRKGQFFSRHRDGAYRPSSGVTTKLTFMLYLNDGDTFSGGHTDFFDGPEPEARLLASYQPRQGSLIVFDHRLWHEGRPVHEGEKIIMRSDFLFRETGETPPEKKGKPNEGRLRGHQGYVWALQALADGSLASGSRDRTLRIWNSAGTPRQTLHGHQLSVLALSEPRPGVLVSGSRDRTVRLWIQTEKGFHDERTNRRHQAAVIALESLNFEHFASADASGLIAVHRVDGGAPRTMNAGSWVWGLAALSRDRLASVSENGTLSIWDWRRGRCCTQRRFPFPLTAVAYAFNRLVVGGSDGSIHLFPVEENRDDLCGAPDVSFSAHKGAVRCLSIKPCGTVLSGGEDGRLMLKKAGSPVCEWGPRHGDFVTALTQLRDGRLASGSYDGTIQLWRDQLGETNQARSGSS